jgi:hypothetical protein
MRRRFEGLQTRARLWDASAVWSLPALCVLWIAQLGCSSGGTPQDECDPSTFAFRCEGDVAVNCVYSLPNGPRQPGQFVISRTTCEGAASCKQMVDVSGCVVSDTPCDPEDPPPRSCSSDGHPVMCQSFGERSGAYLAYSDSRCEDGNRCFDGFCSIDDTPCDRATYQPTCAGQQPTWCWEWDSERPRVIYAGTCEAPNPCLQGDGWATCVWKGALNPCDPITDRERCEDDARLRCQPHGGSREDGYWYGQPCSPGSACAPQADGSVSCVSQ